jgi:hypothetical protein
MTRDHLWRQPKIVRRTARMDVGSSRDGGIWRSLGARLSRIFLAVGLVLTATGCAAWHRLHDKPLPAQTPVPVQKPSIVIAPPPSQPPPVRPKRQVHETREPIMKEPERIASIDPKSLVGLAPAAVEKLLGAPSNVSKGDPSLVWTYAGQGCTFQIFFYPDLKTASFHALKYGSTGGGNDPPDSCIRGILTVRSNGPG